MGFPARKTDRVYTYGDYRNWPADERWELIDGIAWNMSPAPSAQHQRVLGELFAAVKNFLGDGPCEAFVAPFDVLLPDSPEETGDTVRTVVQPDISVVCSPSKIDEHGCTGAPDWVVEILSPYTSRKDFNEKLELYERHGVREYWLIEPTSRYVHVYLLDETGKYPVNPAVHTGPEHVGSAVLAGFEIALERLFRAPA